MRLTPPAETRRGPGPVLEGLHPRHRAGVPQADDRAARGLHRPDLRGAVRRRPLRRRAPGRDHRRGRARRDRRGQRRLLSRPAGLRAPLGADRLLQPGRGEGPRGPPHLLRLSRRRPLAAGTPTGPSTSARSARCSARSASSACERGAPPLPELEFIHTSEHLNLWLYPPRSTTRGPIRLGGRLAQPRVRRALDRRRLGAARAARLRRRPARLPQPRLTRLRRRRADALADRLARRLALPRDRLRGPAARPSWSSRRTWSARSSCRRRRSSRRSTS